MGRTPTMLWFWQCFFIIHGCNLHIGDTMIDVCLFRNRLRRCLSVRYFLAVYTQHLFRWRDLSENNSSVKHREWGRSFFMRSDWQRRNPQLIFAFCTFGYRRLKYTFYILIILIILCSVTVLQTLFQKKKHFYFVIQETA
jgi:hypothetical protein